MSVNFVAPEGINLPKSAVEQFAEDVAQAVEFQHGGSMEELVSRTGGEIVFGSSGIEDAQSGSIVARDHDDYTIYLSQSTSRLRDRFTVAHEIGHLLLHLSAIKENDPNAVMRATRWIDEEDPSQRRAEWEANWFAAAFLMPKQAFIQTFEEGGLSAVQSEFDVSSSAAEVRARSLGL